MKDKLSYYLCCIFILILKSTVLLGQNSQTNTYGNNYNSKGTITINHNEKKEVNNNFFISECFQCTFNESSIEKLDHRDVPKSSESIISMLDISLNQKSKILILEKIDKVFEYYNNMSEKIADEHLAQSVSLFEKVIHICDSLEVGDFRIAYSYAQIASFYSTKQISDSTFLYLNRAIESSSKNKDIYFKDWIYFHVSNTYENLQEFELAVRYDSLCINLREMSLQTPNSHLADAYSSISLTYISFIGDNDKGIHFCKKAIPLRKNYIDKINMLALGLDYHELGVAYERKNDFENSLNFAKKAKEIYFTYGAEPIEKSKILYNIAYNYYRLGVTDSILVYLHNAKSILQEVDFHSRIHGNTLMFIANTHNNNNNHDSALYYYDQVLSIRELQEYNNEEQLAWVYFQKARVYEKLNQYEIALKNDLKALELRKKVFGLDNIYLLTSYNTCSWLYERTGDLINAILFSDTAIKNMELINSKHNNLKYWYCNKAYYHFLNKEYDLALSYSFKSLDVDIKENEYKGNLHALIGDIYSNQSLKDKAIIEYKISLDIIEFKPIIDSTLIFSISKTLGDHYFYESEYNSAIKFYQKALKHKNNNSISFDIADINLTLGLIFSNFVFDDSLARLHLKTCINISKNYDDDKFLNLLQQSYAFIAGHYLLSNNFDSVLLYTNEFIIKQNQIGSTVDSFSLSPLMFLYHGISLAKVNKINEAKIYIEKGLVSLSSIKNDFYYLDKTTLELSAYITLSSIYSYEFETNKAKLYSEKAKVFFEKNKSNLDDQTKLAYYFQLAIYNYINLNSKESLKNIDLFLNLYELRQSEELTNEYNQYLYLSISFLKAEILFYDLEKKELALLVMEDLIKNENKKYLISNSYLSELFYIKALYHFEKKEYKFAQLDLEKSIEFGSKYVNYDAHFYLALTFYILGNRTECYIELEKIENLNRTPPTIINCNHSTDFSHFIRCNIIPKQSDSEKQFMSNLIYEMIKQGDFENAEINIIRAENMLFCNPPANHV